MTPLPPEPCVFVIWSSARGLQDAIVADLERRFALADVVELTWPGEAFSRNLMRLYGSVLPPGSEKELETGTGPFVMVVAVDERPRYGLRRTSRGLRRVNVSAAAAKRRYRRWSGGGFKVHGSLDAAEAERDLRVLMGVGAATVVSRRWDGRVSSLTRTDPEWPTLDDLVSSIAAATPASVTEDGLQIHLNADDVWWAAVIAGGDPPDTDARAVELEVTVGGAPRHLRIETLRSHAQS
jgi:hypothetical protein